MQLLCNKLSEDADSRAEDIRAIEANPFELIWRGYIWIRSKDASLIPLVPNDEQAEVVREFEEAYRTGTPIRWVVLKPRQVGMSTIIEACIFCLVTQIPNRNAMIMADESERTANVFAMAEIMYESLAAPETGEAPELMPDRVYSNRREMRFGRKGGTYHGSQIRVGTATSARKAKGAKQTSGTGRSYTCHYVHYSECGSFPDMKAVTGGLNSSVPKPPVFTVIIYESTADKLGGPFHNLVLKAMSGESGNKLIFFAWFKHHEYRMALEPGEIICLDQDATEAQVWEAIGYSPSIAGAPEHLGSSLTASGAQTAGLREHRLVQRFGCLPEHVKWRRWVIANEFEGDPYEFDREYPESPELAFLGAGSPRFHVTLLDAVYRAYIQAPIWTGELAWRSGQVELEPEDGGGLQIWAMPDPRFSYVIGADVCEGAGQDWNVAKVTCRETGEEVARLRHQRDPDIYGHELNLLGRFYFHALLAVEVNSCGLAALASLRAGDPERGLEPYPNLYVRESVESQTDARLGLLGWRTNARTKPLMIDELAGVIREQDIVFHDMETLEELMSFQRYEDGTMGAPEGGNDDCVCSTAIARQALKRSDLERVVDVDSLEVAV